MQENGEIIRRHLDVTKNKWGYNSLNTIFNQGKWGYDVPHVGLPYVPLSTLPNMVYFPMEPWSSGIPCWDDQTKHQPLHVQDPRSIPNGFHTRTWKGMSAPPCACVYVDAKKTMFLFS